MVKTTDHPSLVSMTLGRIYGADRGWWKTADFSRKEVSGVPRPEERRWFLVKTEAGKK
jgi:hypothetical protein